MDKSGGLKRAVFLDRDGVLNRDSADFIRTPEQVEVLPGIPEAVRRLNDAGFLTVVITNQSGIGRGYFTEETLKDIHARLRHEVESRGGRITGIYHCPHLPGAGCDCRKPSPGMLHQAAQEHGISLSKSYFVGDRAEDVLCGVSAGTGTVLVLTGKTMAEDTAGLECPPDFVAVDLPEAVDWIIRRGDV